MKVTKREEVIVPVIYDTFIGYYRIPKNTPIILDSILVGHVIDHMLDCECEFEIKKKDGEYIIIPDVSKIDLCHSMEFFVKYNKQVFGKEIEIKAEDYDLSSIFLTNKGI